MNSVYWIRRTLEDVPESNSWLCLAEQQRLDALRIPKRRADWRLGRWTAKQAVNLCLNVAADQLPALSRIEIRAAPSGAPEVFLRGSPAGLAVSISHRDGVCICAVAMSGVDLGCDVEVIEPHTAEFMLDYFDVKELETIANAEDGDWIWMVSLMWSAKESALKALKEGLRADARSVQVSLSGRGIDGREWNRLVVATPGRTFRGWWKTDGVSMYTFAADPPISPPTLLKDSEMRGSLASNF